MAIGRDADPKPRKSRAKGRTAKEQHATAHLRIQSTASSGATELDLSGLRKLHALPPEIAQLTALESLNLTRTRVNDLTPLANLAALRNLFLGDTEVRDLTPIANLTSLELLDLSHTRVDDLAPLAGLHSLKYLYLDETAVGDLTPIAGLRALQILDLSRTQITDLMPLTGLIALKDLTIALTEIVDFAPLSKLTDLQSLTLVSTRIGDLTPLVGLTAIKRLNLARTVVSNLTPLAHLKTLQVLYLSGTMVSDLTPLAGLTALRHLALGETQVSDLSPINNLTALSDAAVTGDTPRATGGLVYSATPVSRKYPFNWLVQLRYPQSTVETINEIRRQQGLPAHIPMDYEQPEELPPVAPLEPVPGIPSAFGFRLTAGKIALTASSADLPVFPLPTSKRDHRNRLETSITLADDLVSDLRSGKFNARPDYAESLTKYAQRLPKRPRDGNILLADAEARTLRNMFEADADNLSAGLASKLKTLLEQHIGLRVYYPEIEYLYRDVQRGRIERPLPLDAVQGIIRTVGDYTPEVFEPPVGDAIAGSAARGPEIGARSEADQVPRDPGQPKPPPDPLGEVDPRKARDYTVAGTINGLWKAFKEGEKVHKAVNGWIGAGRALGPHVQRVLEWLRDFGGPSDGAPPAPPGLAV